MHWDAVAHPNTKKQIEDEDGKKLKTEMIYD
jgi:hypothetical protein